MIGVDVDIKDIEMVLKNKVKSDNIMIKSLCRDYIKSVEDLSQQYVARGKTGKLADSMQSSVVDTPTSSVGIVEYTEDYALKVHERHGGYKKGERKRFLYKSLKEEYTDALSKLKEGLDGDV